MSFLSRVRARCLPMILLSFGLLIAVLIPATIGMSKNRQDPPPSDSPSFTVKVCANRSGAGSRREVSLPELLSLIRSGKEVRYKQIKASTLVAAITELNQTKSRGNFKGNVRIRASYIYGDIHLEQLENQLPVDLLWTTIEGDVYIDNVKNSANWWIDTITGALHTSHSQFAKFEVNCVDRAEIQDSQFNDDASILSANDVSIEKSKFDASLIVGTVLAEDKNHAFRLENSSVARGTDLWICSARQSTWIIDSTFGGQMDVSTTSCGRQDFYSSLFISGSRFNGKVHLSRLRLSTLDFERCTFSDLVDLSYARIDKRANFSDVDFADELSLLEAHLPTRRLHQESLFRDESGVRIERVSIAALRLRWEQLTTQRYWTHPEAWYETKVQGQLDESQWDHVEHAVAEIDNSTSTLNEIRFRRHLVSMYSPGDLVQFIGWGFGYRPLWLAEWILGFIALYAYIYWKEAKSISATDGERINWARLKFAISFSWRTALSFTFGYKNSITPGFRIITGTESVLIKVLLVMFLHSLTHISPLLNDIARSIIPS
jgi:hypothetical protein